jgi:hypothetical protein
MIVFTPENLLDNIESLGPWSSYALAEIAICHYFPDVRKIKKPVDLIKAMSDLCFIYEMYWSDWIIMYHNDIGYKRINPRFVNEY